MPVEMVLSQVGVQEFNDLANQISSVLVVFLFLKALPPIISSVLDTVADMKAKDLERIKILSDMWERQFILLYGEMKDDRGTKRDQ